MEILDRGRGTSAQELQQSPDQRIASPAHRKSFSTYWNTATEQSFRFVCLVPLLCVAHLTPTPELWSLLNFVLPEVFDSLENFQSWFDLDEIIDPAESRQAKEDKLATHLVEQLHVILQPFLLRRLKSDLPDLKLPPKRQIVVYVPFSEPQRIFYDLIKLRDFHSLLAKGRKIPVMNILMQLRKACNHPFLFDEIFDTFYAQWKTALQSAETTADSKGASNSPRLNDTTQELDSMDVDQPAIAANPAGTKRYYHLKAPRDSSGDTDRFGLSDSDEEEINRYTAVRKPRPTPEPVCGDPNPVKSPGRGNAQAGPTPKNPSSRQSPATTPSKKRKRAELDTEDYAVEAGEDADSDDDFVFDDGIDENERNERLMAIVRSQPSRRNDSAFILFCAEKRAELAKQGGVPSMDLHAEWGVEWRNLPTEEKRKFEEQAAHDRLRYLQTIEEKPKQAESDILIKDPKAYVRSLVDCSGKLQLLDRMLPELRKNGHKVLIFSQFTRMLHVLEDYLDYSGYSYCRLDGSVVQKDRQVQIDRFNKNPDVFAFLLSTRAGGLGINLNAADTVFLFDSDWNPQMDLQAQDRCHRIGQTRPVVVFRLITANSVESTILRKASQKLKLGRLVIHKDRFKGEQRRLVTEKEMLEILNGDALDGLEKTITEAELQKMLDRKVCMEMFDSSEKGPSTEAPESVVVDPASANAASQPTPVHQGYELIDDSRNGQLGLAKI